MGGGHNHRNSTVGCSKYGGGNNKLRNPYNLSEQVRTFLDTCGRPSLGKPFLPEDLEAMIYELAANTES